MATLSQEEYWDKVYACWLGKNCGGTLGAPLEHTFGQEEPFAIDWYPELREGGIPNDDLEMQLIWLKAIEEQGFELNAQHLAQYWLDHIGYNWDEYGLNKTNLRLGLLPPVSGYFNNWFRDCMGSPIRSEIWACLAPGNPTLAVHYAYQDAIVDHAGGEGVWGEVFNAALESAAFVEHNPQSLIATALSYIPPESATAKAIQTVLQAKQDGISWQEARRLVMAATPHYNAQYAPLNIGFQMIGWLYGTDFGNALCTAVNCGYDTDCTGATLGALLGILGGRAGLPEKWTAPLGEHISTNESWGGLRYASTGTNPIPKTLQDLTDRVCQQGIRLLVLRNATVQIGTQTDLQEVTSADLRAPVTITKALWNDDPLKVRYRLANIEVDVRYDKTPAVIPGIAKSIELQLHNPHPDELILDTSLILPQGWTTTSENAQTFFLPGHASITTSYELHIDHPALVQNSNTVRFIAQSQQRPTELLIPLVLLGARRWLIWRPEVGEGFDADASLDQEDQIEQDVLQQANESMQGTLDDWQIHSAIDNALPESIGKGWVGVLYARLFLWNPQAREVHLGIPATCPRKFWLNRQHMLQTHERSKLRPNYGGDGVSYAKTMLKEGWNEVLIKYTRDTDDPPFEAHFTLAASAMDQGLTDVTWTHFPWEEGNITKN